MADVALISAGIFFKDARKAHSEFRNLHKAQFKCQIEAKQNDAWKNQEKSESFIEVCQ